MNRHFWNITSIYGLGFILLRGLSFLLLPLYTNLLSTKEAGQIFVFITFLAFMNAFFTMGMDSSLLKYYHKKNSISTSFIGSFIIVFPLIVLLLLSANFFSATIFNNQPMWIFASIVILSLDVFSSRIITIVRILEFPFYYLTICLANVITSLVLNIYCLQVLKLSVPGAILAMIGASVVQLLISIPVLLKFKWNATWDYALFKDMFKFAWPFFPATIFLIIIELSDRFMIQYFWGFNAVGLYGAGYKIAALLLILIKAFNLNWQPYYLKQKDNTSAQQEFANIGNIAIVGLIFTGSILFITYPLFFSLSWQGVSIVGSNFTDGGSVVPWVVLGYFFYGLFILQMPAIYLQNKQNWAPFFWGSGAIINIICNLLFIPQLGFVGAAISTTTAYLIMFILIYFKNKSWLPINYNLKLIFYMLIISGFFIITSKLYGLSVFIIMFNIAIYAITTWRLLVFYQKKGGQ